MTNKPKTNKWVDKPYWEILEGLQSGEIELTEQDWQEFLDRIRTQTQQDTLEWCLKEVEKNKNHIMIENFDVSKKYSKGWNNCVEHISQAIKQRIKSLKENNGKH